jgi:ADP-dependent NAD(P)H-hydrate dehydratase / NAD(P)H-hydrate epimerase
VGCAETEAGAIADLPPDLDLDRYDAIACGPGLSQAARPVLQAALASATPLLIDADGLNVLAELDPRATLRHRSAPTLLTPHPGEFQRLFPELAADTPDAGTAAQAAAAQSQSVVLLKGACSAIAHPDGRLWFNTESTPALARGGSGDLLTGLTGGLLAQATAPASQPGLDHALNAALLGTWWHAQAAQQAAIAHTELGVDGPRLASYLTSTLAQWIMDY